MPEIVPPQVQVTANIRRLRSGVGSDRGSAPRSPGRRRDKMLYMKSSSGADGTYTLTISFELEPIPISTRNVNNRVADRPCAVTA